MANESCPSGERARCKQLNSSAFGSIRSKIEGIEGKDRGPKSRRFVRHTRTLHMRPRSVWAWRQRKIFWYRHSSPRKLSTCGPHRRRPRARRADRTAGTIAAVLPPVETAPIGKKSAGGPPRTAAVAPLSILPSIFLVALKAHCRIMS